MARNETGRRWSASMKVSLGPLQWQRHCSEEWGEATGGQLASPQDFRARLQVLVQQAISAGCPPQEVATILLQLATGDAYVDA